MTGLKHAEAVPPSSNRKGRHAAGVVVGLVLAATIVGLCCEAPRFAWLALLVAALVLLDVALGLGIRQWLRG